MIRMRAPAKVNLVLRVLAREESGFHQLETLFAALEFGDELTFQRRRAGISLSLTGPHIGPPEENLVYRAASVFLEEGCLREGLEIHLEKRIPTQSGLGGGSSDAATTLRALDSLFPGVHSREAILSMATRLGSDVPFFLSPTPLALAWGRGDRLLSLSPLPSAPAVVAVPPAGVSTPEAYRLLAGSREKGRWPGARTWSVEGFRDWDQVASEACNDFQEVILPVFPLLTRILDGFSSTGPRFALLSGSGSALFAVYRKWEEAVGAAESLSREFPDTRFLPTRTLDGGSDPFADVGVEGGPGV